jgi:PAS domain S-box-containing protein
VDASNNPRPAAPPPETLDELYEHAPCGYLTTQADGTIVRVNTTLLVLLGETPETLLGRPIQSILTPGARTFYETHGALMLRLHGFLREIQMDLVRADGGHLPTLVNWRCEHDASGHLLGDRVMVVSAVERVAFERELLAERERTRQQEAIVRELNADLERRVEARTAERVELQKMEILGQVTGGVAHDFNNLLTPIILTLNLLQSRYLTDERALRMVASSISAAERARTLIARLLAFARRQHLRARAVDIGHLINGMLALITETAGSSIAVHVGATGELPPARVDRSQIEMALLNLCANARDAMPDGGHLMIAADTVTIGSQSDSDLAAGQYIRLSVSDTGAGMDHETLHRAVDPFYSTKDFGKGTGLGLSMVHGLAAQSGGKLTLDSRQGHGTTATVWLPVDRTAAPVAEIEMPAPAATAKHGLSILLVDDDDLVRFATGEMLVDLGHTIVQASSGAEALEAMRQHAAFDLLITDYLMPGMTGAELARAARKSRTGLPVLLVTGYANVQVMEGGALPHLTKPFSAGDLSRAITDTLARAAPVRLARPSRVRNSVAP